MAIEMATEKEMEDIGLQEAYALALRFQGCEAQAEKVERKAEQMRADVWKRLDGPEPSNQARVQRYRDGLRKEAA